MAECVTHQRKGRDSAFKGHHMMVFEGDGLCAVEVIHRIIGSPAFKGYYIVIFEDNDIKAVCDMKVLHCIKGSVQPLKATTWWVVFEGDGRCRSWA